MIILKALAALKGGHTTTAQLDEIFKRSSTPEQFNEKLDAYIKDKEKFREAWVEVGVAKDKKDIWFDIVVQYYSSVVSGIVQSILKIKHSDIQLNLTALEDIHKDIANAFDIAPLGISLTDVIRRMSRDSLLNSEVKYKKKFAIYEDQDYSPLVRTQDGNNRVINSDEAMRNFGGDELFSILNDLYGVAPNYLYTPLRVNSRVVHYSMYFSFLRTYFGLSINEINDELNGIVELSMRQHEENKFRKLDTLMETVIQDYILPGIYEGNLAEFQLALIDAIGEITINNTAAIFKLERVPTGRTSGNLNTPYIFVSPTAISHFDDFTKALIALSRLYHQLKKCGVSPYAIQPQIFFQSFENPAKKYKNLKELVDYNKQYVEIFNKYNMKKRGYQLYNLCNAGGYTHYTVADPKAYGKAVEYSMFITLSQAARAVFENHEATTIDLKIGNANINLYNLAKAIRNNINPLYLIMNDNRMDYDAYEALMDEDSYIDEEYARVYLSELLNRDLGRLAYLNVDVMDVMTVLKEHNSCLGDVLHDMAKVDIESEIDLIIATVEFAKDVIDLEERVNLSSIYAKYKSSTEYSSIILKSDLFKEVKHLVGHREAFSSRAEFNDVIVKMVTALLNKYVENKVDEERIRKFLFTEDHCPAYNSFITYSILVLFRNLCENLGAMNAHYLNLSDHGKPIKLSADKIDEILNTGDLHLVDEVNFRMFTAGVKKDSLNYLIDQVGRPFHVTVDNNKTGILHASGLYIYSDGTARPWRSNGNT